MFTEHEMLIQEWLEALNSQGKSAHTLAAYRRALNHFLHWYKAGYTAAFIPDAVLPRHVWDWKAYQQTVEKSAPATINQRLVAVTGFFHWAAAQGLARTWEIHRQSAPPYPAQLRPVPRGGKKHQNAESSCSLPQSGVHPDRSREVVETISCVNPGAASLGDSGSLLHLPLNGRRSRDGP